MAVGTTDRARSEVVHSCPGDGLPGGGKRHASAVTLPSWLDELVPLLDPTESPRVLTRAQAKARGNTDAMIRHRVGRHRWQRLLPGVYLTVPGPPTAADHRAAALAHGGPGSVLSGAAALAVHGLLTRPIDGELVLVHRSSGVRSFGRVRIRSTQRLPSPDPGHLTAIAPAARAVADYVRDLSRLDDVRTIVGRSVQRRLTTVAELAVELEAGERRGSALFRRALAEVGYGAHSAPEAQAAAILRRAGITGFEQNVAVIAGGKTYIVDFLLRRLRAVLEIDSRAHHYDVADWRATMRRHADLEAAGYSVIHVSPADLADEREFVARVRSWLSGCR